MQALTELLLATVDQVWLTFSHNWPYLLLGTLVAATMKLYMDTEKVRRWLIKYRNGSIFAAVAVAVATPLCSCGTMAIVLGMLASTLPWAPVVAFMVSSPLTSPEELLFSGGLFGWPFAITFFVASIGLGLAGGFVANLLESRGWLANQARFRPIMGGSIDDVSEVASVSTNEPLGAGDKQAATRPGLRELLAEIWRVGRRLLIFFFVFAFVGYFLNNLIPASMVTSLFGAGQSWGVLLAALLGLPLYLNSEASLPLIKAFMENGASQGAALAFLITGAGTSVGAVVGALAIARWRVVGLVMGTLFIGAILFGYGYNAFMLAYGL
jgi:uncharacterized protein